MATSKEALRARIAGRYPDGVSLTADGLMKLFDTVWDAAHERGVENGRALEELERGREARRDRARSILDGIFGGP